MRDYKGEEILVIPRALFDELGSFQGIQTDVVRYLEAILDPANNFFMDRAEAEEDPSHKQIIPYAIFHHDGRYLHYTRGKSGGESRLHAQGSVGIGGHINPVDERADPLGRETQIEYTVFGKEAATIDAAGRRTEYTYNARGLLTQTTYPDGTSSQMDYDPEAIRSVKQIGQGASPLWNTMRPTA